MLINGSKPKIDLEKNLPGENLLVQTIDSFAIDHNAAEAALPGRSSFPDLHLMEGSTLISEWRRFDDPRRSTQDDLAMTVEKAILTFSPGVLVSYFIRDAKTQSEKSGQGTFLGWNENKGITAIIDCGSTGPLEIPVSLNHYTIHPKAHLEFKAGSQHLGIVIQTDHLKNDQVFETAYLQVSAPNKLS